MSPIQLTPRATFRGPEASPSRRCRTSPSWTTRSSLGRAYRDDMRALRNDSVDVYARARRLQRPGHQPDRAPAAGGRDAIRVRISTRNWSRSFIAWAVRRGPACRDRADARSRMPCRLGVRGAARVGLAHHGLTNQAGRECSSENGAAGSAGSDADQRTSVTVRVTLTRRQGPRAGHRRRARTGGTPRRTDGSAHGDARDARTRRRRRDTRPGMPQAP